MVAGRLSMLPSSCSVLGRSSCSAWACPFSSTCEYSSSCARLWLFAPTWGDIGPPLLLRPLGSLAIGPASAVLSVMFSVVMTSPPCPCSLLGRRGDRLLISPLIKPISAIADGARDADPLGPTAARSVIRQCARGNAKTLSSTTSVTVDVKRACSAYVGRAIVAGHCARAEASCHVRGVS